jgi:hypothetical protein
VRDEAALATRPCRTFTLSASKAETVTMIAAAALITRAVRLSPEAI